LIAPEGQEEEAVTRLARVGYDNTVGYLKGGVKAYEDAGRTLSTITSFTADSIAEKHGEINIVDVRKPGEYDSEHVIDAISYPLDYINNNLNELDKSKTYYLHCAGGYRSVIAISLLMKNGYTNLIDIAGGFGAIHETNIPKTAYVCPSTLK
jgi:rhodanese-related sulfurtransferase